ncbi:hypothetical protein SUGI_0591500 [Cryptomeria japonica]|nr:hypothetical protein SUGI_0591500 [Cryptomeria japonica]
MDSTPLYIQRWHRNFNPLITKPYEKPIWIRLNNLPMEYWTEEALNKIGRSLGTLIDIDSEIAEGDSYLYARLRLAAVREIPTEIRLISHGKDWIQTVEIEEDKVFCLNCGLRNHPTINWRKRAWDNKVWRPKQLVEENQKDSIKVFQNQSSEIETNMVSNGKCSPQPESWIIYLRFFGECEEEDGDDEIDIAEISHIEQSVSMEERQGEGNKGRKTNKLKREEEAVRKGLMSVLEFLKWKSAKGAQGSLGNQ